jgi:hypothetical protein
MHTQAMTSVSNHRTASTPSGGGIAVEVPEDAPTLYPGAAQALLRLLLAVAESDVRDATRRTEAA